MALSKSDAEPDVLRRPKVLIIDDDEAVGQAVSRSLQRAGLDTAWASTGDEALKLTASFMPDVALVDLTLPDTNGLDLVARLVQKHECGVIIVSGLSSEADRIAGLELGADDYISKPPHLRELLARIRAVCRRVRTERVKPQRPSFPASR